MVLRRHGLLVPAPGVLAWDLEVPPAAELSFVPGLVEPEIREGSRGIDQDIATGLEAAKDVDLVKQGGVLDDQRVGGEDGLAQPDRAVVDATEGDHRRAGPLRAEAREGL